MTLSTEAIGYWSALVDDLSTPTELERQEALLTRELDRTEAAAAGLRRMLAEVRRMQIAATRHDPYGLRNDHYP